MARISRIFWRYVGVAIWLIFTSALATWWIIFSYRQIARLADIESSGELVRHQTMLLYEGATLLICLLGGGIALLWQTITAAKKNRQIADFFSAFTHELKTPLASLRLQAELLSERLTVSDNKKIAERLLSDTRRLNLQLENSLLLSHLEGRKDFLEDIDLLEFIGVFSLSWPELRVVTHGNGRVRTDRRIFEVVLSNLARNAVVHAAATELEIKIAAGSSGASQIELLISDNGKGFFGEPKSLGCEITRHYSGSGSGVGLYLSRKLIQQLGGKFDIRSTQPRFIVEIILPAAK